MIRGNIDYYFERAREFEEMVLKSEIREFSYFKKIEIENKYPNLKKDNYVKFIEKLNKSVTNKFAEKREELNKEYISQIFA